MDIMQLMNGVRSGTIDARSEVMKLIKNMTPAQRQAAMGILPKVESIARQMGIPTDGFKEDVSSHLI